MKNEKKNLFRFFSSRCLNREKELDEQKAEFHKTKAIFTKVKNIVTVITIAIGATGIAGAVVLNSPDKTSQAEKPLDCPLQYTLPPEIVCRGKDAFQRRISFFENKEILTQKEKVQLSEAQKAMSTEINICEDISLSPEVNSRRTFLSLYGEDVFHCKSLHQRSVRRHPS